MLLVLPPRRIEGVLSDVRQACLADEGPAWAPKQGQLGGLIKDLLLDDVEIRGRKRTGKAQLQIDEARRFVAKAFAQADDPLALACATMLLTGLRPGDVMNLRVRDCDDGGNVLWVEAGKTDAGRRRVEVAKEVRPHLLAHATGRQSLDYLFELRPQRRRKAGNPKARTDALLRRVRSLCLEAGVPSVCAHSMRGLHSSLWRDAKDPAALRRALLVVLEALDDNE
jgi:integrase